MLICKIALIHLLLIVIEIRGLHWAFPGTCKYTLLSFGYTFFPLGFLLVDELGALRIIQASVNFDIFILITVWTIGPNVTIVIVVSLAWLHELWELQWVSIARHVVKALVKGKALLYRCDRFWLRIVHSIIELVRVGIEVHNGVAVEVGRLTWWLLFVEV